MQNKGGRIEEYFKDYNPKPYYFVDGDRIEIQSDPNYIYAFWNYIFNDKSILKEDREYLKEVYQDYPNDINVLRTLAHILNEDGSEQSVNDCINCGYNESFAYRVQEIAQRTSKLSKYHKNSGETTEQKIACLKKEMSYRLSKLGEEIREMYVNNKIDTEEYDKKISEILQVQTTRRFFKLNGDSKYNGYQIGDFNGLNGYDEETGRYYFTYKKSENEPMICFIKEEEIKECDGLYCGLENCGATCYANATLQMFFQAKPILAILNKLYDIYFENGKLKQEYETFFNCSRNQMIKSLIEVAKEYKTKGKKVQPFDYLRGTYSDKNSALSRFYKKLEINNPLFKQGAAGDSKDLMMYLCESLNAFSSQKTIDTTKNYAYNNELQKNDVAIKQDFKNNFFKDYNSFVSKIFYSCLKTTMRCCNCQTKKFNYQCENFKQEPIKDILQYTQNTYNNIIDIRNIDCYDNKNEFFTGDNSIFCNECRSLYDAIYNNDIFLNTPKHRLYVLSRGRGNSDAPNTVVNMPLVIKEQDGTYKVIKSMVTHAGESGMGGHFTNNLVDVNKNNGDVKIMLLNDSVVSKKKNLSGETPYVVEYEFISKDLAQKVIDSYKKYIENVNNTIRTNNFHINEALYDRSMNFIFQTSCLLNKQEIEDSEKQMQKQHKEGEYGTDNLIYSADCCCSDFEPNYTLHISRKNQTEPLVYVNFSKKSKDININIKTEEDCKTLENLINKKPKEILIPFDDSAYFSSDAFNKNQQKLNDEISKTDAHDGLCNDIRKKIEEFREKQKKIEQLKNQNPQKYAYHYDILKKVEEAQKKANAGNNVNNNNNNNNNGNNNNINEEEEKKKQQQQYEEERKKIEEESKYWDDQLKKQKEHQEINNKLEEMQSQEQYSPINNIKQKEKDNKNNEKLQKKEKQNFNRIKPVSKKLEEKDMGFSKKNIKQ